METVRELIARNARNYPRRDCFVLEGQRQTYAQREQRVRQLGSALYRLGMRRQDRIGILSANRIEYFEVSGACDWSGFICALYNFRSAAPEIEHLVRDSDPTLVVFELAFLPQVELVRARLPQVRWICLDGPAPDWALRYEEVLASGDPEGPPLVPRSDDFVWLFYTSGTTGRPKGVPYDHAAVLATQPMQGRTMGRDVRMLQVSPAFHVGGMNPPNSVMWMAGTTVLTRRFDPGEWLEVVERERITHTFMVPMMMQAVMDHPEFSRERVRSLRSVMAASTAIPVPLLKRSIGAFGPVFYVAYGSTECGGVASLGADELKPDGTPEEIKRIGSVGHFEPEQDIVLLDDEGRPCPPGVVGEVCVKRPMFRGYWNNTLATIEATRTGWLHSGDLGMQDEEGFVYLVDRKKDMIISGGENIYSREVEDALLRHPAVAATAVVGVPDERWGEAVKAYVTLRPGQSCTAEELITHCRGEIARYKCPRQVEFMTELPMLGTGKIDKPALRRHAANPNAKGS